MPLSKDVVTIDNFGGGGGGGGVLDPPPQPDASIPSTNVDTNNPARQVRCSRASWSSMASPRRSQSFLVVLSMCFIAPLGLSGQRAAENPMNQSR